MSTSLLECSRLHSFKDLLIVAKSKDALHFLERAVAKGSPLAKAYLAISYFGGNETPVVAKDTRSARRLAAAALPWLREQCENRNVYAMDCMGRFQYYGLVTGSADYVEAVKWYRSGAELGHADSLHNLGWCYWHGKGVRQNFEEAYRYYSLAADQEHQSAQFHLGECYEDGKGCPQDYAEALRLYTLSANAGYAPAQHAVGFYYYQGDGVPCDFFEAVKWFTMAANQGYADAQYELGESYENGEGVLMNIDTAMEWYKLSAEQNHIDAQFSLALLYAQEGDYVESAKWYQRAANEGHPDSQYQLGEAFREGLGVDPDRTLADLWTTKAANVGHLEAKIVLQATMTRKKSIENMQLSKELYWFYRKDYLIFIYRYTEYKAKKLHDNSNTRLDVNEVQKIKISDEVDNSLVLTIFSLPPLVEMIGKYI